MTILDTLLNDESNSCSTFSVMIQLSEEEKKKLASYKTKYKTSYQKIITLIVRDYLKRS